jgi:omega-6 fatty acid desaturase (delta-12 desaturase)
MTAEGKAAGQMPLDGSLAAYATPQVGRSVWQLASTLAGFVICWYLALRSIAVSYALTLLVATVGAVFFIRLFIIQHDCGHGSFFRSRRANDIVGRLLGIFTLTPY